MYALFALAGIISAIWGYETYLLTFINPVILLMISLTLTFPTFLVIRKHYSELYRTNGTYFPFFQSLFSIGLLTTSAFLIVNYQFSTSDSFLQQFKMEETGTLSGKNSKPYAVINRQQRTKKLVFKRNPTIQPSDRIELTIQEGLFGFDIITNQQIISQN